MNDTWRKNVGVGKHLSLYLKISATYYVAIKVLERDLLVNLHLLVIAQKIRQCHLKKISWLLNLGDGSK